jgi:two-component system, NarL family, response regulator NreC
MPLRVLLADDHAVVREGFRLMLEREGLEVVGEAADGRDACARAKTLKPDVAVLDLSMPHLNGVEAGREILRTCPGTRVVLLTLHAEQHQVITAIRAGIRGYVLKSQTASDLIHAIRAVAGGDVYLSPGVSRVFVEEFLAPTPGAADLLAPRELQILKLIAEGKTSKEIATLLNLTVKSVESYRSRIMDKLDIHQTAGLVRYAIRSGLIEP